MSEPKQIWIVQNYNGVGYQVHFDPEQAKRATKDLGDCDHYISAPEYFGLKSELAQARAENEYLTRQLGDALSGQCDVVEIKRQRWEINKLSAKLAIAEAALELLAQDQSRSDELTLISAKNIIEWDIKTAREALGKIRERK